MTDRPTATRPGAWEGVTHSTVSSDSHLAATGPTVPSRHPRLSACSAPLGIGPPWTRTTSPPWEAPALGLTAATCGCGVNSTSAPPVPAASSRPEPWPTCTRACPSRCAGSSHAISADDTTCPCALAWPPAQHSDPGPKCSPSRWTTAPPASRLRAGSASSTRGRTWNSYTTPMSR